MIKTVIWSKIATKELQNIKKYWDKRNKSKSYSEKIIFHTELGINIIKSNPQIGVKSNISNVRMRLILQKFYLIYQIDKESIKILRFWDVRQNPIKIKQNKGDY